MDHETKTELQKDFDVAVQRATESGEPHAIILAANPPSSLNPTGLSIESFSLQDAIAKDGADEIVFYVQEDARCYGRPNWLIDLIGDQFQQKDNAFEEAWDSMQYYYEEYVR